MLKIKSRFIETVSKGKLAILYLNRPEKRNAVCEEFIRDVGRFLSMLNPDETKAIVLTAKGDHFCAGLDLEESKSIQPLDIVKVSETWYEVLHKMEFSRIPIIAAMQGAVIGGGLELVAAAHVRVADTSAFYQLPEGKRGIFVGGGATVRISRILGIDRMREMMLTGRKFNAAEGQQLGLSHYLVPTGSSLEKAFELAETVANNADTSNYMILNALPRIGEMGRSEGLFTEAISAALTLTSSDAIKGIDAFLSKKKVSFDSE